MATVFPVFRVGQILFPFTKTITNATPCYKSIDIQWPCRLGCMTLDPAALTCHDNPTTKAGVALCSVNLFLCVKTELISDTGNEIIIDKDTKRQSVIKHATLLMYDALKISPTVKVSVDEDHIPKHCGFGTTSSLITAICTSINELYGKPISEADILRYAALNHAEETDSENNKLLQATPCVGGGAASGLSNGGITIVSKKLNIICSAKYDADVLIGLAQKTECRANTDLMAAEESSFDNLIKISENTSDKRANRILHHVIPDLMDCNISSLADAAYDYAFKDGIVESFSAINPQILDVKNDLSKLYTDKHCSLLALSSVGPAYFTIVENDVDKNYCRRYMENIGMTVIEARLFNSSYKVTRK